MKKIKLRYAKHERAFLEQEFDSETTNRISITQHELDGIIDFLRNPTDGRYRIYSKLAKPVMISFNSEDHSYVIERDETKLFGVRSPFAAHREAG